MDVGSLQDRVPQTTHDAAEWPHTYRVRVQTDGIGCMQLSWQATLEEYGQR